MDVKTVPLSDEVTPTKQRRIRRKTVRRLKSGRLTRTAERKQRRIIKRIFEAIGYLTNLKEE